MECFCTSFHTHWRWQEGSSRPWRYTRALYRNPRRPSAGQKHSSFKLYHVSRYRKICDKRRAHYHPKGLSNLAEIVFVDANPFYYLPYMVEEKSTAAQTRVCPSRRFTSFNLAWPQLYRSCLLLSKYYQSVDDIYINSANFSFVVAVDAIAEIDTWCHAK